MTSTLMLMLTLGYTYVGITLGKYPTFTDINNHPIMFTDWDACDEWARTH